MGAEPGVGADSKGWDMDQGTAARIALPPRPLPLPLAPRRTVYVEATGPVHDLMCSRRRCLGVRSGGPGMGRWGRGPRLVPRRGGRGGAWGQATGATGGRQTEGAPPRASGTAGRPRCHGPTSLT